MLHFNLPCLTLAVTLALSTAAAADGVFERGARGDSTQFAGARRVDDELLSAYRQEFELALAGRARNVILLIGDGMGDSEITAARNFAEGAGGYFKGIDALPFTGQYTHHSLEQGSGKPSYVTDSAASATAWSSGIKTYNGAVGVDIKGRPHTTLLELARKAGLGTGNVTTAEIQDATPAAMYAHVAQRKCYTPAVTLKQCPDQARENGGPGSISEQLLDGRYDVMLGGGAKYFEEQATAGDGRGRTLLELARSGGFQLVSTADELAALQEASRERPVLGLFAPGNMPVRLTGPQASKGGITSGKTVQCQSQDRGTAPTLAQMTAKALELLERGSQGFMLQVEGASIDKQAHANNPCGQFGETVDLDEAVQVAMEFARRRGDTLVIVTADHAHATQIVPATVSSPGYTQLVMTRDGVPMGVSYGNADDVNNSVHTGAQLRVAAYGPGAAGVLGLTDQTDLFFLMRKVLDLPLPEGK